MTLSILAILIIIEIRFTYWVADFIFQAEEWAINKSKSFATLIKHTLIYTLITALMWLALFPCSIAVPGIFQIEPGYINTVLASIITFVTHTCVDYFTSKSSLNFRSGR
jgi:hypothetical protein